MMLALLLSILAVAAMGQEKKNNGVKFDAKVCSRDPLFARKVDDSCYPGGDCYMKINHGKKENAEACAVRCSKSGKHCIGILYKSDWCISITGLRAYSPFPHPRTCSKRMRREGEGDYTFYPRSCFQKDYEFVAYEDRKPCFGGSKGDSRSGSGSGSVSGSGSGSGSGSLDEECPFDCDYFDLQGDCPCAMWHPSHPCNGLNEAIEKFGFDHFYDFNGGKCKASYQRYCCDEENQDGACMIISCDDLPDEPLVVKDCKKVESREKCIEAINCQDKGNKKKMKKCKQKKCHKFKTQAECEQLKEADCLPWIRKGNFKKCVMRKD